jgi:hypothetical protein
MTLWKLVKNHQHIYGKLTLKNMRATGNRDISPLLLAFVYDGSVFFALYVSTTHLFEGRTYHSLFLFGFQRIQSVVFLFRLVYTL